MSQSISEIVRGLFVIALALGMLAVFSKLPKASRLVMGLGGIFMFVLLLARARWLIHYLKARGVREDLKERVVVADGEDEIDRFLGKPTGT